MEDLTGRQFGQYQIVASLGEGGMAAVYKAYQPAMDRFVAVKVLPRHMASAEFALRFRREARMLAQLQHPHILPVFDYGEADDYPYIVMPFVHSGTMADILHTRRLSFLEVRRIMTQIGDALSYAHARGMIHRDIKPSNILIDERGNCLLTDFGLARMVQGSTQLTTSGTIMGTPAYMSPEQGAGSNVDHRSDIYSLGIILYEMVTGRVPFTAETPVAVVFKHIQDPLPSARKFNPDLPEGVELVLLKALAKSPDDRYQTVDDFVHAIQKVIPDTLLDDKVSTQAHSSSLETARSPIVAQAAEREGIAIERGTKDIVAQPHSRLLKKSSQTFAIVKNRKLFTALIFILVGLVLVSMISLAQSYKILVIDPPLITETYNISNLSTSTSMDNYYTTSTFSKDQDVYIYFDLNYVQADTPFQSKWYYQVNILGKEVYFLTKALVYTSESGDSKIYFHLNKPGMKGYYRVDIYMNNNLVGTRYFWVQ